MKHLLSNSDSILLIVENVEKLLELFDIECKHYDNRISISCPIHTSSRPESLSIFTTGDLNIGIWKCWTNHCENDYEKNIVGFFRALLLIQLKKEFSYYETIKWCLSKLGNYQVVSQVNNNQDLIKMTGIFKVEEEKEEQFIDINDIIKICRIPASYYLERGYKKETLELYKVGYCYDKSHELYNRIIVPLFNNEGTKVIGLSGRTIQPYCVGCKQYHYPNLPCGKYINPKWKNNNGFKNAGYLYNYWIAKSHIIKDQIAIIVEGKGDIWRLHEAGLNMGLGLLGSSLQEKQKRLLESLNIRNLLIATDNDLAGINAKEKIIESCERLFNIHNVTFPKKDLGDCTVNEIQKSIYPILERI